MRHLTGLALLVVAGTLGGCAYLAIPPDPIRYVTSAAEVGSCRKLGPVGLARTDGEGPATFEGRTKIVPLDDDLGGVFEAPSTRTPRGEIVAPNFAIRVETMRDSALALGATDLLLSRRIYRDYSYVEGIAYRCRH